MNNKQIQQNKIIYSNLDLQFKNYSSPSFSISTTEQSSDIREESDNQNTLNLLFKYISQNNPKEFRSTLSSNFNLLSKKSIENIFLFILNIYISDKIFATRFLLILIPFGINPNVNLNELNNIIEIKDKNEEYNPSESILMLFCSKSNSTIISCLCESKVKLDINYLDTRNRNALFYLKGESEDRKIIEMLVEKGINVNQRDIDGNTALHNAIIYIGKKQLIYDLIEVGNINFMIKNNQNNNSLDLINQKWISKKNSNFNKYNIIDYKEIKEIIELIKKKLSIKLYGQSIILSGNENNSSIYNSIDFNNLIKLPSINVNKSLNEVDQNINDKIENRNNIDNNIFLKLNKNPSLIIDTQFNDGQNRPLSKKIEYYKQMNKNKKYFINLLKNSDNFLLENSKNLKKEIENSKLKLKELKIYLNTQKQVIDDKSEIIKKELMQLSSEVTDIKKRKEIIRNKICKSVPNIADIKPNSNFLFKYEVLIIRKNTNKNYIYNQLQRDLLDYMYYVQHRNSKLKNTILKIKQLLKESVLNCLGKNYEVKIYGSRETGLCLPWSDIDAVISFSENEYLQPLNNLYLYLKNNFSFVDIKYIENTQIPLIKVVTSNEFQNMSLDISLELPEHHGAECVSYIKEKIKEYDVLSPLTFALKTIFQKAKINDPYTGGLSSYGIILLIIYFLKLKQNEGEDISLKNLGKLFYELLLFYGNKDSINDPIDVTESDRIQIKNIHIANSNNNGLVIIDPLNIYNNVAKNMRQITNIRFALNIAIVCINESCECGCHYQHEGLCIKEEDCEHNLLNNIFNSIKRDL